MSLIRDCYRACRLGGASLRFSLSPLIGSKSQFAIPAGYQHRRRVRYFDDTSNSDNWQREVYETARRIMIEHDLSTVHDIGCGSGYKLVHTLGEFDTVGVDLPETIERVRKAFPERKWVSGSFDQIELPKADLVICSDVIEHVVDPDRLMQLIVSVAKDWVVLSTPAREVLYQERDRRRYGPPENPSHIREWSVSEFGSYVGSFLRIEHHEISNRAQATQMIVARAVSEGADEAPRTP